MSAYGEQEAREQQARPETTLERAVQRAQEQLLRLQRADGHWCGELEGDSILESEYLILLNLLGAWDDPRCEKLAARLRQLQTEEGGWAIYPGGPAEVSASVKAYLALKLVGDSPEAPHMRRARAVILERGGVDSVNSFTCFYLAMLGQMEWDRCPAVPPELVLLPSWSYFNIYAMSSWSRAIVVPLTVLWALRPVRHSPRAVTLSELRSNTAPFVPPAGGMWKRGWRAVFRGVDRAVKTVELLGGFAPTRGYALRQAEKWILQHLEKSDGLGAIFPAMVYAVLALVALGHSVDEPLVQKQLKELIDLELPRGETLQVQPTRSPVWDTALVVHALGASGFPRDHSSLQQAARWLLDKEVRTHGDWRVVNSKGRVGGWFFQYNNAFYPDCDDTAQVLLALAQIEHAELRDSVWAQSARGRAREWLLSMQNPDGGWAAFDRGCTREVLTHVPFADHNALLDESCPDITGRMLQALASERLPPQHPAVRRAVRYLETHQEYDGSWYGRWGCNYLYGTFLALGGLRAAGYDMRSDNVQRAAWWLESKQNEDGGWGETFRSYDEPQHKAVGPSTAAQTAWAMLGLLAVHDRPSGAVVRGAAYLLRMQQDDGTWRDELWTGTGFPRVFNLRYDYYDDYFPLLALGALRARLEAPA